MSDEIRSLGHAVMLGLQLGTAFVLSWIFIVH